jgi:hypothetical protein
MKTMIILLFAVLTSVSVAGQNLTLIVKDVSMWTDLFTWLSIFPNRPL